MVQRSWSIVGLIFLFMLINYADKAVIGLSATSIIRDLHLTGTQFGTIGSAFFLFFAVSGIVGGFLANHVSSKALLFGMAILWAAAQAPMIGAVGFSTLFAARAALGLGEGPAFPLALHAVYKWFEDDARTVPTSVIACGAAFGAGVVAPLITFVITRFGWHAAFGVLAAASLVWALIWAVWGAEGRVDVVALGPGDADPVPYRSLVLSRTALGVFLGGFAAYWALTLNIVWLAAYLVKAAHFTLAEAGWIIVLPSVLQIILAPSIAAWSDARIRAGTTSRIARGAAGGLCLLVAGTGMILLPLASSPILEVPLVALAFSVGSVFFTLGSPLIAEISPPRQRGAMLGITNSVHSLAGLIAPVVMGWIVDVGTDPATGFRTGFMAAGAFVVLAGILTAMLIDPATDLGSRTRAPRPGSRPVLPTREAT